MHEPRRTDEARPQAGHVPQTERRGDGKLSIPFTTCYLWSPSPQPPRKCPVVADDHMAICDKDGNRRRALTPAKLTQRGPL